MTHTFEVQTDTQPTVTQRRGVARRAAWAIPVLLFLGLSAVFAATAQTNTKVSVDVYSSSLAAWRIGATGTPWLDQVDTSRIDGYGDLEDETVFIREAANGHRVPHRLPGAIAAAVPAYWLAGGGHAPDDFSLVPQAITAALMSAAAVTLFFLAVRPWLGTRDAVAASTVLAFTTPIWSVAANALWPHTVTVLGICGMAWAASRERWLLVGLFGGVAIWGRLHTAIIVAVLGLGVATARRSPRIAVAVAAVSATCLALTSVWTQWVYGSWNPGAGGYSLSPTGTVGGQRYETDPSPVVNALGLWISPDRGILVWTPVLLLLLPAVVRSWRDLPDWSRWLALGGVAYTLVQGQLNFFDGGGAHYGYRLGLELLVCAAPAYALSVRRAGGIARACLGPLLALQLCAIMLGAVLNGPAPAKSFGWSDNAFFYALRLAPALGAIILLVVFVGHVVARDWQRRRPAASPAQ